MVLQVNSFNFEGKGDFDKVQIVHQHREEKVTDCFLQSQWNIDTWTWHEDSTKTEN